MKLLCQGDDLSEIFVSMNFAVNLTPKFGAHCYQKKAGNNFGLKLSLNFKRAEVLFIVPKGCEVRRRPFRVST